MGKRVHTTKSVHILLRKKGYTPLFDVYGKYKELYPVECVNGHKIRIRLDHVQAGHKCGDCIDEERRFTLKQARDIVIKKGFVPLFKAYFNANKKIKISCQNGHVFETPLASISRGYSCFDCYQETKKYVRQQVVQKLAQIGYGLMSPYTGIKEDVVVRCENGHVHEGKCVTFLKHKGCYRCKGSQPEILARELIENITGHLFPKKRPLWLRNPKSGLPLELDGYCEELKIAFEYNGRQHYEKIPYWSNKKSNRLSIIQRNDALKVKKCKEKNVYLIVLSGKPNTIESQIKKALANRDVL